jgi:hypothetical protein
MPVTHLYLFQASLTLKSALPSPETIQRLQSVRPVCHVPDGRLKRRDEAGEGAERCLERLRAGCCDILGDADFRQAGLRFAAEMDFGPVGKLYYDLCRHFIDSPDP